MKNTFNTLPAQLYPESEFRFEAAKRSAIVSRNKPHQLIYTVRTESTPFFVGLWGLALERCIRGKISVELCPQEIRIALP